MTVETVTFAICALIVLGGAMGVIWSRNPVHSALSLVATLFGVAVLFLNQNAQLLAAVQVIVYTGAIVVLILFVIMLLGVDREEDLYVEPLVGQRTVGAVVAIGLFLIVFGIFMIGGQKVVTGTRNCQSQTAPMAETAFVEQCAAADPNLAVVSDARPNVNQLGRALFTDFVFAFEVTAGLLTIAVVGAVVLSRRPDSYEPLPEPEPMGGPADEDEEVDA